jgi:adenylylsulfate kinase
VSWAIWITGLPGSGKSAIARAAAAALAARGDHAQVLELDQLRRTLTPAPAYDPVERDAVYRALVAIAAALTRAGLPVIIDATAHRRAWRDLARAVIADFAEVQLVCPLDVARERERARGAGHHPREIYAKAGRPGATVPGVDVPYEPAVAPELTLDTTQVTAEEAGVRVADLARTLARRVPAPSSVDGWAVWVSGRPGSGKTTVAAAVRDRLSARGVSAALLEPQEFSAMIAHGAVATARHCEMATRAMVQAAKLLSDAGVPVIIDGTSPATQTEALARELLESFAQVELVCPPEICRTRERAVRWNLVPHPAATCVAATPDLGLAYEPARRPDLLVYTDAVDVWTAADEVLRLADRLARAARERRRPCA